MRPRLSKTNRADSPNGGFSLSIPESRKRTLTDCDGISLRKEVRDLDHLNAARLQLLNLTYPPCLTPLKTAPGLEIVSCPASLIAVVDVGLDYRLKL